MKKLLTLVIPPLLLLALFSGATSLGAAGLTSLGQTTYAAVPALCPTGQATHLRHCRALLASPVRTSRGEAAVCWSRCRAAQCYCTTNKNSREHTLY